MSSIDKFLVKLARYSNSDIVINPYRQKHVLNNLRKYFAYMFSQTNRRILLVAEAPGYKGCAITGIPFTSGQVFQDIPHPLLLALKDKIQLPYIASEKTATIVWQYLTTKKTTPLFWNSFPFHPHHQGNVSSNRTPKSSEIKFGAKILNELWQIYQPEVVAAIGKKGLKALEQTFPEQKFAYIRHPSYGGKNQFIEGMDNII